MLLLDSNVVPSNRKDRPIIRRVVAHTAALPLLFPRVLHGFEELEGALGVLECWAMPPQL